MRIWQQSEVYLEKCSVRENKATSQGGGVYVPGSRVRISYTEFSRNSAIRGRDMYIVTDGVYNASSAPSVKLYTYRCVFTLNATRILTADEYFMEEAQEGGLIYGNDVNVYNEETPYASGRYRASQTSVLMGCPPPLRAQILNLMQFLANFGKIVCWHSPCRFGVPPTGNPGSAPGAFHFPKIILN